MAHIGPPRECFRRMATRSARVVEQPYAVAEQDGRDEHEDLVERARVDALAGDLGAQDVYVLLARDGPVGAKPSGD